MVSRVLLHKIYIYYHIVIDDHLQIANGIIIDAYQQTQTQTQNNKQLCRYTFEFIEFIYKS